MGSESLRRGCHCCTHVSASRAATAPNAVSKDVVDRFFALFVEMDKDGTGVVDLDEFYRFFKLERSPFADRVFSIMGEPFVASRRLTNRERAFPDGCDVVGLACV